MHFTIHGNMNISLKDFARKRKGLQRGGPVQKFIDNEVMKQMSPMMPRASGITNTVIGSGYVNVNVPYARFTYYGKVMIYEPTGSTYAPKDGKKIVTQTDLKYQEAPTRGAFYFERMKKAKRAQILKGAQEIANKL